MILQPKAATSTSSTEPSIDTTLTLSPAKQKIVLNLSTNHHNKPPKQESKNVCVLRNKKKTNQKEPTNMFCVCHCPQLLKRG